MSEEKDDKQSQNPPIHTHIKSDPISTPGYWRLFTTWIMMRYGTRVGVDLIKKKSLDEASHRDTSKTDFLSIQSAFRIGTKMIMLGAGKKQGQIIAMGTPDEIRNSDNPEVQQFINGHPDGPIPLKLAKEDYIERLIGHLREGER